jgi:hypothetical protein
LTDNKGAIMNQTTYKTHKNPSWWTDENESSWERVKSALKRDWDQTKHDFGGDEPDTNQKMRNTIHQASGKEAIPPRRQPAYDDLEPAVRFGYGARSKYGTDYTDWDDKLEANLRKDWEMIAPDRKQAWREDRAAIRYGWDFDDED